jgi:hypothetical protein
VPWVLEQLPTLGCATVQGQAVCLWPGQLQLELGCAGGSFQLDLQADRAADVRLPETRTPGRRTSDSTARPLLCSTRTARRACASPPVGTA